MKSIFLSRPTFISKEYEQGMDNFLTLLRASDIEPRTIGTTDFNFKSPMDGVIELMRKCSGAIILGYPQIVINDGLLKDTPLSTPVILGTEWNHIEAALAYSLGIPTLVIRDRTVSTRGVFDRGTLNAFLYPIDLKNASWSTDTRISGAIRNWRDKL